MAMKRKETNRYPKLRDLSRVDALLDDLLGEHPTPGDILGESGLLKLLGKRPFNQALVGELNPPLQTEAAAALEVDPTNVLDEKILALYARGLSVRDISAQLAEL